MAKRVVEIRAEDIDPEVIGRRDGQRSTIGETGTPILGHCESVERIRAIWLRIRKANNDSITAPRGGDTADTALDYVRHPYLGPELSRGASREPQRTRRAGLARSKTCR